MSEKFIKLTDGFPVETETITSSAGAGDAGKIAGLDAGGKWDVSLMPAGVGVDNIAATASEALAAGDWINLYLDTTLKARKADGTTNGKPCHGFVKAAVDAEATATVYRQGYNTSVTGKTIGAKYFLGLTAGADTATAPSTAGNYCQYLGIANATTSIMFEERQGYTRG